MLKKLGRRLTLLNLLISGAILIAMALSALTVAESVLVRINESELNAYSTTVITAIVDTTASGDELKLQVPAKYTVVVKRQDEAAQVMGTASDAAVSLTTIEEGPAADMVVHRTFRHSAMGENAVFIATQGIKLIGAESGDYRVLTAQAEEAGEAAMDVFIMQNRTEELEERTRLRLIFLGCIVGGVFLIFLSSLFLSGRAIAPVEKSLKSQREFVAAASHELRTPLAAVRANAEVLKDAELGEYKPYLKAIEDEGARMTKLVGDLLGLARSDAGQLDFAAVPIDAAEVVNESAEMMRPLIEARGLSLTVDAHSGLFAGDPDRLKQVLIALIDNAIRYTERGGIAIEARKSGHTLEICVSDTGIGIPEEHKARVFDRFYRVDAARMRDAGGAGLGLSIAKDNVEKMRGEICVEDAPSGGCTIVLKFPAL